MKKIFFLLLTFLSLSAWSQEKPCTTTLNPGSTLNATMNAAAGGSVICLNAGTYTNTSQDINGRPSSEVIVRSTTGNGAVVVVHQIYQGMNYTFKNLTLTIDQIGEDDTTGPRTMNISLINVVIMNQIFVKATGNYTANYLFDNISYGNSFDSSGGAEGRLWIHCNPNCDGTVPANITVSNSVLDGTGSCSDAIQINTPSGIFIRGNIIENWLQSHGGVSCGPHVDATQLLGGPGTVTIEGNWYINNEVHHGFYDGHDSPVTSRNNIFQGNTGSQSFQIGGFQNFTFEHNTVVDIAKSGIGTKFGDTPNNNWIIRNNIFVNAHFDAGGDQPGCGTTSCIITNNQLDSSSSILSGTTNTNNTTLPTTWIGGSRPTTWVGWTLSAGSNGTGTATDGKDRGNLYRNPGPVTNIH